MSSQGYFYTPEEQEQLTALQRKQAYAKALLQSGGADPGTGAYAGLRNAGGSILGAILANKADTQERGLTQAAGSKYTKDLGAFLSGTYGQDAAASAPVPTASPQISNNSGSGPEMAPSGQGPQVPPSGPTAPAGGVPAPAGPTQPQAPQGQPNPLQALVATGNPALMQQFGPSLLNNQLERGNKLWENNLPLSQAAQDQGALSLKNQEAQAQFTNQLPMTAAQQATQRQQGAQLSETARHNKAEEMISQNPFGGTGMGVPGAGNVTGDAFLATLNPGLAAQIKAVGTYRQPAPAGRTSPTGIKFMTLVNQAYPSYDASQYGAKTKARNDFSTGKNGNTVRSLNVAVQHLDQLGQLSDALGNGNVPLFNKLGQVIAQQTGSPAPTNFDAAKQIIGDEIVKAVVGTGGTGEDRDKAAASINRASSPQQLSGVIKTYQNLMSGQLGGLKQQYEKTTGLDDFEDYLAPETKAKLQAHAQATTPAQGSGKVLKFNPATGKLE